MDADLLIAGMMILTLGASIMMRLHPRIIFWMVSVFLGAVNTVGDWVDRQAS